ncbi:MAG: acyl-CoA/acyl-ACP dehydrogenase [Bdellovibrionales bacterium]|nr:acyl-CoA/acyl-ACP dehydrogenase [Bdellovibrionales bacterium]
MEFLLPEELVSFEASLRQFFTKNVGSAVLRSSSFEDTTEELKLNQDLWQQVADLGVFAACVSEGHGGLGMGIVSAELILGLSGEFLIPVPVFETLGLGAAILANTGDTEYSSDLLSKIAAGELRVTAALEQLACSIPDAVVSTNGAESRITGKFDLCPSADFADVILVPALNAKKELRLYAIERSADGIKTQRTPTFDCIRPFYQLDLNNCPASALCEEPLSSSALAGMRDVMSLCAAAEMTGAARRCVSMSVDYAQTRTQFGKPIGSFQAIAHKLADMHVLVESSQALVRFAAWACDNDQSQSPSACSAAKAYASKVCPKVAQEAIQAHGGIGFTYEYDLHFFLRRTRTLSALFGTEHQHSAKLAELSA